MRRGSCYTASSQLPRRRKWQASRCCITFSQLYLCDRESATLHINFFSSMGDQEQQGISGVPSANQQDGSRQSASTAHQQTDPSVMLETLKAIMKRVAVEAIEDSQRRTPASSLPPTTTTGKPYLYMRSKWAS